MNKLSVLFIVGIILTLMLVSFKPEKPSKPEAAQYVVIAWNDLGMHCANLDFTNMCILPPYNNQKVHIIQKGSSTALPVLLGNLFREIITNPNIFIFERKFSFSGKSNL